MDVKIRLFEDPFRFDLAPLSNNDFTTDDGFENAIIISLFTDKRASRQEVPSDETDLRGWWADAVDPLAADLIGSKLWLLDREKATQETLNRAREYTLEALAWLEDLGLAETVEAEATWADQINGRLRLDIAITRPDGDRVSYTYSDIWENQTDGI